MPSQARLPAWVSDEAGSTIKITLVANLVQTAKPGERTDGESTFTPGWYEMPDGERLTRLDDHRLLHKPTGQVFTIVR